MKFLKMELVSTESNEHIQITSIFSFFVWQASVLWKYHNLIKNFRIWWTLHKRQKKHYWHFNFSNIYLKLFNEDPPFLALISKQFPLFLCYHQKVILPVFSLYHGLRWSHFPLDSNLDPPFQKLKNVKTWYETDQ